MIPVTQGALESQIYEYCNRFEVDFDGKSIKDCIEECRKLCDRLHSEDEINNLAFEILSIVENEYGFLGIRLLYSVNMKIFGDETLAFKYSKLVKDISNTVESFRVENNLTLKLDVYLLSLAMRDFIKSEYGIVSMDSNDVLGLYSVINYIQLNDYQYTDKDLELLEIMLVLNGDNYYHKKIPNIDVDFLRELHTYIGEVIGDEKVFRGHDLFHSYDGYGNVIYDLL